MLEILFLISIYRGLANKAKLKGRPSTWGLLGVGFWIGGEFLGFIIGGALGLGLASYGVALLLAGIGAITAYFIVGNLTSPYEDPAIADAGTPGAAPFDPNNPYSPPGRRDNNR